RAQNRISSGDCEREQNDAFRAEQQREVQARVLCDQANRREQQSLRQIEILRERFSGKNAARQFCEDQQGCPEAQREFPETALAYLVHGEQEQRVERGVVDGQKRRAVHSGKLFVL